MQDPPFWHGHDDVVESVLVVDVEESNDVLVVAEGDVLVVAPGVVLVTAVWH